MGNGPPQSDNHWRLVADSSVGGNATTPKGLCPRCEVDPQALRVATLSAAERSGASGSRASDDIDAHPFPLSTYAKRKSRDSALRIQSSLANLRMHLLSPRSTATDRRGQWVIAAVEHCGHCCRCLPRVRKMHTSSASLKSVLSERISVWRSVFPRKLAESDMEALSIHPCAYRVPGRPCLHRTTSTRLLTLSTVP